MTGPAKQETPKAPEPVTVQQPRNISSALELDPRTVDPNMHYRWVRNDPLRITKARLKGYDIVKATKDGPTPYVSVGDSADGTIRVGDVILMACTKAQYELGRVEVKQTADDRLRRVTQPVKKLAKDTGVQLIKDKE